VTAKEEEGRASAAESMSDGKSAFGGTIGKSIATSKPRWPDAKEPPAGAPNILVVRFDDGGFSDFGCYCSVIKTQTVDRGAAWPQAPSPRTAGF
jgi:hypothetical protein